ncbi:MAG: adenosylcobinamide-phosphate synthase CbiB [Syntrophobacteraceae bacterium]|jgi:adenosylcobinamide-phosphate synthase|nr:adenosylcobinamide-phosphate synthase CbiB [Syntrophobacteraceae bacterium]
MVFLPWHLTAAYFLDLLLGDPSGWPHPVRWIGRWIEWCESLFHDEDGSPGYQRIAGLIFWLMVVGGVACTTLACVKLVWLLHPVAGAVLSIWISYAVLATRSLHAESRAVVRALAAGDLPAARKRLSWIVSRDTSQLGEREILRAVIETVAENISDGIVAPLLFLALGGPVGAMTYKAVNTMDSMVGYLNDRYRYFGWFAARADDVVNFVPSRLTALLMAAAAAALGLDWRNAWKVARKDARRMKSPNAGYPEAAAAGALHIQLGGSSTYFGQVVMKPTLGEDVNPLSPEVYSSMIRLMYATSFLAFLMALGILFALWGRLA